jgi:threonine/homoserine/homoserine lactone efflux protein
MEGAAIPFLAFVLGIVAGLLAAIPTGAAGILVLETALRRGFRQAFIGSLGIALVDTSFAAVAVLIGEPVVIWLEPHRAVFSLLGGMAVLGFGGYGLLYLHRREWGEAVHREASLAQASLLRGSAEPDMSGLGMEDRAGHGRQVSEALAPDRAHNTAAETPAEAAQLADRHVVQRASSDSADDGQASSAVPGGARRPGWWRTMAAFIVLTAVNPLNIAWFLGFLVFARQFAPEAFVVPASGVAFALGVGLACLGWESLLAALGAHGGRRASVQLKARLSWAGHGLVLVMGLLMTSLGVIQLLGGSLSLSSH